MPIPSDVAAKVLFYSDRTCCVCRVKGKPVQIHHIDGDNSNDRIENLAVLCLDCHTETQLQGGFHRKLDAEQVRLYRDDWLNIVARDRAVALASLTKGPSSETKIELVTSIAEILRENEQYELLAIHYDVWGNSELRDKYIEKALSEQGSASPELELSLRALQGKADLVDPIKVEAVISEKKEHKDWSQLARLYVDLGRWEDAVKVYCQSIIHDLERKKVFPAAFYLKELAETGLHNRLFEMALREETEKGELWWQVRCLQELGWHTELEELVKSKREEIERSGNLSLQLELYRALKDEKKAAEVQKKITSGMQIIRVEDKRFPGFSLP